LAPGLFHAFGETNETFLRHFRKTAEIETAYIERRGRFRAASNRWDFEMSKFTSRMQAAYHIFQDNRARRRTAWNLAEMEDAFLKDIGISRVEIIVRSKSA
jgi:uncharacterized protein YjiS (DUF1127 family)